MFFYLELSNIARFNEMKIFKDKKKLKIEIGNVNNLAFIPTMGYLHKGHLSLIKKAQIKSKNVLVSIFVNPKQFNSYSDYKNYPKNLSRDIKILKKNKVKYLYIPNYKDIYSHKIKNKIYLNKFVKLLCGKFRKGHFKGVVNVVNRFIEILKPKNIFLGLKDYQQLILIKHHFLKNNIKTKIIECASIREKNGIVLSSRNFNLNSKQIKIGSLVYKYLKKNKRKILKELINDNKKLIFKKIKKLGVTKIEYLECIDLKTLTYCKNKNKKFNIFIAYYLGKIRLIDNL